jgi:hypothetical protein
MGSLSTTFRALGKTAAVAAGAVVIDQALGGHGANLASSTLKNNGFQGLNDYPYVDGLLQGASSLTKSVKNSLTSFGVPTEYSGYATAGLGVLATVGGWALSNVFNGNGKGTAYKQAQNISDKVISRVKDRTRSGLLRGSKASGQTYQGAIQQELTALKSHANTALSGLSTSLDPLEQASQVSSITSSFSKLKEKGVISGTYTSANIITDPANPNFGQVTGLSASDQQSLSDWSSLEDIDISSIATRKATSATKSGWGGTFLKTAALAGGALVFDQVVLGGTGFNAIKGAVTGVFNAPSWNPYDLAAQAGKGILDTGTSKILGGAALMIGGGYAATKMASEHGGMMGISTMLLAGAGMTWLGMNSDPENDVNWSNKSESFITGGQGGFADFAKEYAPDWSMKMGGP